MKSKIVPPPRVAVGITAFTLLLLGQSSVSAENKPEVSAQRLFSQGRFDQACLAYTQDMQKHPEQLSARLGLVRALLRLDRWTEALEMARTTTRLLPGSADAQGLYALAALRAGDPDTAAPAAARALALDGNDYWALVADGRLAVWNGQDAQARRDFRRAAALRPQEPDGLLGLMLSEEVEEGCVTAAAYLRLPPRGYPHDLYVDSVRKFVENWPTLRRAYRTDSVFQATAPVPETALQAWRRTGASLSVTVPLQRSQGRWLVSVLIKGQTFHLVFDTGAGDKITLNPEAARRLHLPTLAQSLVGGIQGYAASTALYAKTMSVGGLTLASIPIDVVPQPVTASDGLFGAAVLDKYLVTLDLEKGLMTVERGRAASLRPPLEEVAVPFHLYNNNVLTRVQVEGASVWALLDTGSDGTAFSVRYAKDLAARSPQAEVQEIVLHGFFGIGRAGEPINAVAFEKPIRVSLGGKSLALGLGSEDIVAGISVLDSQISPHYDFEVPMLLGAPYLDRFRRFTLDYPRREIRFVPVIPPAGKGQTAANPVLDPTRVISGRIEAGYRQVWWSDQWVELPQGMKLGPVAPALAGQSPPFAVPAGYVALRYRPQEAGVRWMLVPQGSETMPGGEVIIR